MGAYQYYRIMLDGIEIQICDYNPVGHRIYEVGDEAFLDFEPDKTYIL